MNRDVLFLIRTFLCNQDIISTLLVCREWNCTGSFSMFTTLSVRPTDNLMLSIRRFLQHKQTLVRTILYSLNVAEEWPFETEEMVLVGCTGVKSFSPTVKKCHRLKYSFEVHRV